MYRMSIAIGAIVIVQGCHDIGYMLVVQGIVSLVSFLIVLFCVDVWMYVNDR